MASYFWVGGSGTWDNVTATNWSLSSGGAGGAGVPNNTDTVTFDANSGTSALVIVTATAVSSNTTVSKADLTLYLVGSPTLCTPAGTLTLTDGTISLNNYNLFTGIFSSGSSNIRTINFGSGGIYLTNTTASATVLFMQPYSNCVCTGTGGFYRNQAATATIRVGPSGASDYTALPNLFVFAGSSTLTLYTNTRLKKVDFTGSSCIVQGSDVYGEIFCGDLTLSATGTYTGINPTFPTSATVTSNGKTLLGAQTLTSGTTLTLSGSLTVSGDFNLGSNLNLNGSTLSCARFLLNSAIFTSIAFGGNSIVLTSAVSGATILDMPSLSYFSWTGTGGFIRSQPFGVSGTVRCGSSSGGTAARAPNFLNIGGGSLTITANSYFKTLNCFSNNSPVSGAYNACGDLTLATGGTYTGLSPTFIASGTITSNGRTLSTVNINGAGITVTLADDITVGYATGTTTGINLTQGTFNAAGFNVTTGFFSSSNSNTRTVNMGSGTWTIVYNGSPGSIVWWTANTTNLTLIRGTSTINFVTLNSQIFAGGGLTYYNLNQGGAGALVIQGSNTFDNITNSVYPATITFTAGTTQTVFNFGLSGTLGYLVTINSSSAGSQATLSKPSGTVTAAYLLIQDSNATGGANWYATDSVSVSNNTGWVFNTLPTSNNNMILMFM